MEPRYRGINQQGSPHIPQSSNRSYFTEQAHRAGYLGPELGRTRDGYIRNNHPHVYPHPHPHPPPYPHPHIHPLPNTRPYPHLSPHPHDIDEAILVEIEKQQIREEIIMADIARRRVLEAEVRREMIMERELALRRNTNGFPIGSSSAMGFDSPTRLPLLGPATEGRSMRGIIAASLEEKEKMNEKSESEGSETLPFQRRNSDLRITEVKPVLVVGKEKEKEKEKRKIIFLANPDENISGSKRKALTPPHTVDATEHSPTDIISKKKSKEEWSCALCQVCATSEQGLKEHVRGKKHKSKEAALRDQKTGKNYSIGLFPKKPTHAIDHPDLQPVQKTPNSEKDQVEVIEKVDKKGDLKKEKYKFWCEMCQVGTISKRVMNYHTRGKKHLRRLERMDQNGASNHEKISFLANHIEGVDEDEKNLISEEANEDLREVKSEDHELMDEKNENVLNDDDVVELKNKEIIASVFGPEAPVSS